jgi:hypothetical protein
MLDLKNIVPVAVRCVNCGNTWSNEQFDQREEGSQPCCDHPIPENIYTQSQLNEVLKRVLVLIKKSNSNLDTLLEEVIQTLEPFAKQSNEFKLAWSPDTHMSMLPRNDVTLKVGEVLKAHSLHTKLSEFNILLQNKNGSK